MFKTINISSSKRMEIIDITAIVGNEVRSSGVDVGTVLVYTPHTTAGITINENADPAVKKDILEFFSRNYIKESWFRHMEGNSDAHILSSLVSPSETLIIESGEVVLGTWQGLFFCEFDGPRNRMIYLRISS